MLFLEGKTVSETVGLTNHSPHAIDRYITNFRQVFTCKAKGLNVLGTSRATKMSPRLVGEYHRLLDDYAVTGRQFDALLKESAKSR